MTLRLAKWAFSIPKLKGSHKYLLVTIALHSNPRGVWAVKLDDFCRIAGVDVRTIRRIMPQLEKRGLLRRTRVPPPKPHGKLREYRYHLTPNRKPKPPRAIPRTLDEWPKVEPT